MSEELLGADITQPLPGEVVVNNTKDAVKTAEEQGKITQQDSQVLKKTQLEAKDVKVDPVVQNPILSPELQKLIAGLPEGKELEFGEQPDLDQKKNVEEIKQEAAGVASTEAKKTQDTGTSQNSTTSTETKQPQGSTKEGQIGPFAGPMERLGYLTGTMKKAVAEWWTKNKVTVIIGLVACGAYSRQHCHRRRYYGGIAFVVANCRRHLHGHWYLRHGQTLWQIPEPSLP
ncbi:hypothetical protein [uncultured Microscilla sp.]|uniref:hypothetical protein n=1 Tax=uncultured Microscilla sp. TaxID=432653 RepID=UPI00260B871B|nr:hypothetical protein [uncultured Microscilla sp.]